MMLYTIQIITLIINFCLGIFVFLKNKNNHANQSFGIFAVSSAFWVLSILAILVTSDFPDIQILWAKLGFSFASLIPAGLLIFSTTFPYEEKQGGLAKIAAGIFGVIFFIVPFWSIQTVSTRGGFISGTFSKTYFLWVIYFFALLIYVFFTLIKKRALSQGLQKTQGTYLIAALSSFLIPSTITNLVLPSFGIFRFNVIGPVFTLPMVAIIGYAIVRHRLMDIRVVIQKGLLYLITIGIVAGIYFSGIFLLGEAFSRTTQISSFLSALFAAIVATIGFPHLKTHFEKATDNIFFKHKYNYSAVMKKLSFALGASIDLDEIVTLTGAVFATSLKTKKVCWLMSDVGGNFSFFDAGDEEAHRWAAGDIKRITALLKERGDIISYEELRYLPAQQEQKEASPLSIAEQKTLLEKEDVSMVVPIFCRQTLSGILLLGDKMSGDPFSEEDFTLMETFSRQAGIAIERAQLYEQMKNYSKDLEKRVAERTQELNKLYEAQSKFIGDISHQLQTPLAIIKGNVELLSRGQPKRAGERKTMLETVHRTTDYAARIVRDLLSLARADFARQKLHMEPVMLNQIVRGVHEQSAVLAADKNIDFNLEEKDDIEVMGNKEKLRDLVINLVSNAIKYTASGGSMKLTLHKEGLRGIMKISDTGRGISEKDLPHIFERFFRVESNEEASIKGTGLGLAICKWIVEAHEGNIRAESELGKGTTFTVELPLLRK